MPTIKLPALWMHAVMVCATAFVPRIADADAGGHRRPNVILIIDNTRHEGIFPMTLKLQAGRKLLRVSLDGRRSDKILRIERISD